MSEVSIETAKAALTDALNMHGFGANEACDWCRQVRLALAALDNLYPEQSEPSDMCPNCVTPWKCNGPHVPIAGIDQR